MHDIEWQDSGDGADDVASMRAVLGKAADREAMAILVDDARGIVDALTVAIKRAK